MNGAISKVFHWQPCPHPIVAAYGHGLKRRAVRAFRTATATAAATTASCGHSGATEEEDKVGERSFVAGSGAVGALENLQFVRCVAPLHTPYTPLHLFLLSVIPLLRRRPRRCHPCLHGNGHHSSVSFSLRATVLAALLHLLPNRRISTHCPPTHYDCLPAHDSSRVHHSRLHRSVVVRCRGEGRTTSVSRGHVGKDQRGSADIAQRVVKANTNGAAHAAAAATVGHGEAHRHYVDAAIAPRSRAWLVEEH